MYLKLTSGGSVVREFIPAIRTSDSVVGIYDLVTMTFYAPSGTLSAGPAVERLEGAVRVTGDGYIQIPATALSSLTTNSAFTVSLWYRPEAYNTGEDCVFHASNNSDGWGKVVFWIGPRLSNNSIEYCIGDGGSNYTYNNTGSDSISLGNWYHLAMTYSSSQLKFYLNGTCVNTQSCTTPGYSNIKSFFIGRGYSSYKCNGEIYDVRVWNELKDATAIQALYLSK